MKPPASWQRALVAMAFWAGSASALDAGPTCVTSDDCTAPAGHCHPALHACVECLTDRNCAGGLLCDEPRGVCAACGTDEDCRGDDPYCVAGACTQCRTDANCGEGVVCANGTCGSCGDGVCHLSERILDPAQGDKVCPQDCGSQCPTTTLALNEVREVHASRNLFELECGTPTRLNDVTVSFTAPREYYYRLRIDTGDAGSTLLIGQFDDCSGSSSRGCSSGDFGGQSLFYAATGQTIVFLLESPTADRFRLQIEEDSAVCGIDGCEPETPTDAGPPRDERAAMCKAAAEKRDDPACDGVGCACDACPAAYDDCATTKGCMDSFACMQSKECVGVDCYTKGPCRLVIDSNGGVASPAFRAATKLQSCTLAKLCSLPCLSTEAGVTEAGEPQAPPVDAGALCAPGREVACSCGDAGSEGTMRCAEDGFSFGACVCRRKVVPADSGCDCAVGRQMRQKGQAPFLTLGLGLAAILIRGSRRRR